MRALRVSRYADEDIESIFRYTIRKWGFAQADSYYQLLASARDRIAANPFLPGSKKREDLTADCRTFHCGKHIYFFRVRDDTVQIARVLHESMNFEKHINEEMFT